jgi:hypothetical protein
MHNAVSYLINSAVELEIRTGEGNERVEGGGRKEDRGGIKGEGRGGKGGGEVASLPPLQPWQSSKSIHMTQFD